MQRGLGREEGGQEVLQVGERGGSEGEGGFGWDAPPAMVPVQSPPKAGRKFLSSNPLGAEGAEAKFWLSAPNIGRGGGGAGPRGGYTPCSCGVRPF